MRDQKLHPRTAILNKAQKNQSQKAQQQALAWLSTMFPETFNNTNRIRPLKIGIMNDILAYSDKANEAGISKSKLREAVVLFTRRLDYLACIKAREMRVDLEGKPISLVSEEEADKAANKIKRRIEKSIYNARKISSNKYIQAASGANSFTSRNAALLDEVSYPLTGTFNMAASSHTSRPEIIVKHKPSKQFKLDTVARLKEKLGLTTKSPELTDEND